MALRMAVLAVVMTCPAQAGEARSLRERVGAQLDALVQRHPRTGTSWSTIP